MARRWLFLPLLAALGCTSKTSPPASVDTGLDANIEATAETSERDLGTDTGRDPLADAASDTATDTFPDVMADVPTDAPVDLSCLGDSAPLVLASGFPYTEVTVSGQKGQFLVDFGTTFSLIDPKGFAVPPKPVPGTSDQWASFDFFGPWGRVTLKPADYSAFSTPTLKQAGIVGTDFLSVNIFSLDYAGKKIFRATKGSFCSDEALVAQGFSPLSTAGYFTSDLSTLPSGVPNVPTIKFRVGGAEAVAQLDTGLSDTVYPFAVYINPAYEAALKKAGVALVRNDKADSTLTTCVGGVFEKVTAYRYEGELTFVDRAGKGVKPVKGLNLFVKEGPAAARTCGGIGTWATPAAQIGASFFQKSGLLAFDPHAATVWMR